MLNEIEHYTPQVVLKKQRVQALTVWGIFAFLIAGLIFSILLAPLAEAASLTTVSQPIYNFFSYICHQMPERSFHIETHSFAVCSRCFGVYAGLLFGFFAYPFFRSIENLEPPPRFWLFLALIPMGVDWSLGFFGVLENTHLSRFLTGLIVGATCATFIVPALIELAQLSSRKKQAKRLSR